MGFKDRLFQEGVEKSQIEKRYEDVAESDSSLTKLEQLLDKYKTDGSKYHSSLTEDYEASGEFKPTESEGSVGENSMPGSLAVKNEHKAKESDAIVDNNGKNVEDSLDTSTESDRHIVKFEKNGIRYEIDNNPISEDELGDLFDIELDDPGYVSNKVLDYDDKKYQKEGFHHVNWKSDAVEGTTENVVLEASDRPVICQWSHPAKTGSYFCDPDTKYENLQLQDIQEKREQKIYEVIKDLPMKRSVINDQHFLDGVSFDKTYQYVSSLKNDQGKPMTAKELVQAGYLKEITSTENNK
ncbi:MAG: hypothetical protein E7543_03435 [Ruminococcaceae bacterium]|nr:hypothetical protein [Oscillospiraceae bacterium]